MNRVKHLVPSSDGGDDAIRVSGLAEGRRIAVCLGEEAVDGGLQVDDRSEDAAFQVAIGEPGEEGLLRPGEDERLAGVTGRRGSVLAHFR